jgi:hypothetical protein
MKRIGRGSGNVTGCCNRSRVPIDAKTARRVAKWRYVSAETIGKGGMARIAVQSEVVGVSSRDTTTRGSRRIRSMRKVSAMEVRIWVLGFAQVADVGNERLC